MLKSLDIGKSPTVYLRWLLKIAICVTSSDSVVEHYGVIHVEAFIQIANDNGIHISTKDQQFLRANLQSSKYHHQNGKIVYEEAIKDLVLIPVNPLLGLAAN